MNRDISAFASPGSQTGYAASRAKSRLRSVVRRILADANISGAEHLNDVDRAAEEVTRLLARDYRVDLARHSNYAELRALLAKVTELLPRLNREPLESLPPPRQAELASRLGIYFNAAPHRGPRGLALRGFYLAKSDRTLRSPMMYVNTAHHPLAVSTTFCHEVGHHFVAEIFRSEPAPVKFFLDVDYAAHLDNSGELAADSLVSLAGYPGPIARKLFAKQSGWRDACSAMNNISDYCDVQSYLERAYGLDVTIRMAPYRRLNYLCGVIHYAKLRWALLAEYDL